MEEWKTIEAHPGYEVSSFGRVRSKGGMAHYRPYKSKILKTWWNYGWFVCTLSTDGKRNNGYIHRLVAEAFVPNPNNLPDVLHKSGNRGNNHFMNLEWVDDLSLYDKMWWGQTIQKRPKWL